MKAATSDEWETPTVCAYCRQAITQEATSRRYPRWWHIATGEERCASTVATPAR